MCKYVIVREYETKAAGYLKHVTSPSRLARVKLFEIWSRPNKEVFADETNLAVNDKSNLKRYLWYVFVRGNLRVYSHHYCTVKLEKYSYNNLLAEMVMQYENIIWPIKSILIVQYVYELL